MQTKMKLFAIAAALATAASLIAGGFGIEIGNPSGNPEAQAKHAVLMVRSVGCLAPDKTTFTGSAEGLINGKRQTVALKLIPLKAPGSYAVTRQWPADGQWVISLTATNPGTTWHPSVLVKVNGDRFDWAGVMRFSRAPNAQEIEAALNTTMAAQAR